MAWIDYKKATIGSENLDNRLYENEQNIQESYKIHHWIYEKLETGLDSRMMTLVEVKIQIVIFYGDALSPFLFVVVMIPLIYI